jgi:hypothetical protein
MTIIRTRPILQRHRQRILAAVWLPLELTALCLDLKCSAVFKLGEQTCPACGGRDWASLAKWLQERRT